MSHTINIYIGPSWAERSYDNNLELDTNPTSIFKCWNLPLVNVSQGGAGNLNCFMKLYEIKKQSPNIRVVYFLCETMTNMVNTQLYPISIKHLIANKNWFNKRLEMLRYEMELLNSLEIQIGIIGAHSDIRDVDVQGLSNLEIIDHSYQNNIAKQVGAPLRDYCMGFEVIHRAIHMNKEIDPSEEIINYHDEGMTWWEQLDRSGWFFHVHPNRKAVEWYADYIKPKVIGFLKL